MKRLAVFAAVSALVLTSALPAAAQKDVRFVLDWAFQGVHSFFALADDNGHFAKEGLKVKIDRGYGSGDTINKVAAGTYDVGLADVNILVKFNAKNPDRKVVSFYIAYDKTLAAIIALKTSGIRGPKDLVGRTIAAPVWDNSRILFPIFARANGLDPSSVKWLSTKPHIRDSLLIKGQTDAVAAFATTTMLNMESAGIGRNDLVIMRFSDLGVDLYGTGLLVRETFAQENPALLKGFVRAVVQGTRDALSDLDKAIAAVKKRDSLIKEAKQRKQLVLMRDLSVLSPEVKKNGFSHVDNDRLVRTIGFVAKAMRVDNPPPPRDVFRGDFLPPAAQRMP